MTYLSSSHPSLSPFLVAQDIGEYGGVTNGIAQGISRLVFMVQDQVRSMGPGSWALVLGSLMVLWFIFRKR